VAFTLRYLGYFLSLLIPILAFFTILRRFIYLNYAKYLLVAGIINNSLTIIIGIMFIRFFILTTKEKPETRKYSILLSIGFGLIFILTPILSIGVVIIDYLVFKGFYEMYFYYSSYRILNLIFGLSSVFLFEIGLIISAIGAYKTTRVPLIFAKIKRKETRKEKILKKYNYELAPEQFKEEE
jgi:hypothetical protein